MLNRTTRASQRGLSVVEMTMVVGVMAILAAMAVPSFSAWQGNTRIRASAEAINTGLSLARVEAVSRNTSVTFTLQSDGGWTVGCATVTAECPATIHSRSGAEIGSGSTLVLTQRDNNAATGSASVTFSSRGRPDTNSTSLRRIDIDAPTSIVPAAQSRELRIALNDFGQTRLCDPNAASGAPTAC